MPECPSSHSPKVVVAKDRHDRQPNPGKQPPGGDRLGHPPVLGDVTGDDEQVGAAPEAFEKLGHLAVLSLSHVQIANRSKSNFGRVRRLYNQLSVQLLEHGTKCTAVPLADGAKGGDMGSGRGRRRKMGRRDGMADRVIRKQSRGACRLGRLFVAVVAFLIVQVTAGAASVLSPYMPPPPPPSSADAVYVYDATAGVPLFARDADARLAPGSLTKIVTALVVLEHADLDDVVTIQESDIVDESQSRVQLVAGDSLKVGDLLLGLFVPSGNDAALALARHVGSDLDNEEATSPQERFVAEMNRFVADRGLANVHFTNPSGIDDEDHYASARDLAMLTAEAIENPTLFEFMGTPSATLPSALTDEGYPINTTHDMVLDGTAVAGKTGTTERAGGCLVTVSLEGTNRIITVVLGSELTKDAEGLELSDERYPETRELLALLPERYEWIDPSASDVATGLSQELSAWDASLPVNERIPVPRDRQGDLDYRLVLEPPAEPGAPVGAVLFVVGDELLAEQPVVQAGLADAGLGEVAG